MKIRILFLKDLLIVYFIYRSYYFSEDELAKLFSEAGFEILMNTYVQRRTINFKEGIDVPRIFVQGKYKRPAEGKHMLK